MEITGRPACLRLFASARTSMAWNGSTALRLDKVIKDMLFPGMLLKDVPHYLGLHNDKIATERFNLRYAK
jgi:hypothetical protein